ncbi:acylneuraminate cytidylyltransferase family protein [Aquirufa antheringensis]
MNILAVVPARGGSKGVEKKNLTTIGNTSLVGIAGKLLNTVSWITKSIISSDSIEIIKEAQKSGLDAPFVRPNFLAADTSNSLDMWKHALLESEKYYGLLFDITILIEPTSPFRNEEDLKRTINKLLIDGYKSAATVSVTPAHYTPHKTLVINPNDQIEFYLSNGNQFSLRQNIPKYYHRNGICYACTREYLLETDSIISSDTVAVVIDREVINIDTYDDLEYANYLFRKSNSYSQD